jgi:serine/threonine protein kinase
MAPEVFQQKAYTLSADVYAIGRLFLTTVVPVVAEKLTNFIAAYSTSFFRCRSPKT